MRNNARSLLNLRKRMAKIRVFDPACGSGNFLVIAYKEMRAIEAEINRRRCETDLRSEIPLTNFRGIELRDFPAEIARLALVIAEYQCDVLYRGQKLALAEFLPLRADNWITCGNALRLDWLSICPPTGTGVKFRADDLFGTALDQPQIDFENEGGETYICGNPPYYGSRKQAKHQKDDLLQLCGTQISKWKSLDYVAGWFVKGKDYIERQPATFAFVCTSSNCEGLQVSVLWKELLKDGIYITFAYRPFKWANLAAHNAGVTVNIVGVSNIMSRADRRIFESDQVRSVPNISPYLLATPNIFVDTAPKPLSQLPASTRRGRSVRDEALPRGFD
ncbi:MAG TPA: DNA methyltransferase [Terriglobales bacterium]|nr:DNA methyltransferase [Terriglobales bacterium]